MLLDCPNLVTHLFRQLFPSLVQRNNEFLSPLIAERLSVFAAQLFDVLFAILTIHAAEFIISEVETLFVFMSVFSPKV